MSNWIEWFETPYAENDDLMNDWVESILRRVSWELFERQHDIVKMAYETENGIPVLKDDEVKLIIDLDAPIYSRFTTTELEFLLEVKRIIEGLL